MSPYDSQLEFARKILHNHGIHTYLADGRELSKLSLDNHLREQLIDGFDYLSAIGRFLNKCRDQTVYFSEDTFCCRYTVMKLPGRMSDSYFLVGPYMFIQADNRFLLNLQQKLSIPNSHMDYLQQYYRSVPYIEFEDYLRSILLLLATELFGGQDQFSISYCDGLLDTSPSLTYTPDTVKLDRQDDLEQLYNLENNLLLAVASGNQEKTELLMSQMAPIKFEQRLPNHLRDSKNYLIILNTLLRKAAESGGVHPIYIDDISSQFARKIELISGDAEHRSLTREMARKYCMLVQSYSTKGYSPVVQKVMNHISSHLSEELGLKSISARFSISPTYLSSLFKKETGSTLTEFVNRKRMEQAVFLLNSSDLYIQTIAAACGIPDLNYFTKLFKKQSGMTPSEYRTLIHR